MGCVASKESFVGKRKVCADLLDGQPVFASIEVSSAARKFQRVQRSNIATYASFL